MRSDTIGPMTTDHMARHHADEAVFTFAGTDSMQSLVGGREITAIPAIAPRSRRARSAPKQSA
jgi:glutaryl-CoA dehydrogenase